MKRPRSLEFTCLACGTNVERLVETNDDGTPCEEQLCEAADDAISFGISFGIPCGGPLELRDLYIQGGALVAPINRSNGDFNERQRERLEKRSADHWRRKGKDEAVDRQRTMMKKHGA